MLCDEILLGRDIHVPMVFILWGVGFFLYARTSYALALAATLHYVKTKHCIKGHSECTLSPRNAIAISTFPFNLKCYPQKYFLGVQDIDIFQSNVYLCEITVYNFQTKIMQNMRVKV